MIAKVKSEDNPIGNVGIRGSSKDALRKIPVGNRTHSAISRLAEEELSVGNIERTLKARNFPPSLAFGWRMESDAHCGILWEFYLNNCTIESTNMAHLHWQR